MKAVEILQELSGGHAARSRFAFRLQGAPDGVLSVRGFTSTGHALSADYRFKIELLASRPVDFGSLLGKGCVLELCAGGDPVHGILASFEGRGHSADGPLVAVELASPLFPLSLGRANRVFIGRSAPQILEEIAKAAGIETRLCLAESYPEREFTVQYAESDFDFLCRLAASWGIFFRFEQTAEGARLLFHDRTEELPFHGQILYREHSGAVRPEGTVFAFHSQTQLLPAAVEMRDYNYRTPETSLRIDVPADEGIPARGTESRYWENAKDLTELQRLARLRRQALDGGRETFVAESDCRALSPGMRFALTGHPDMRLNGEYIILGADHEGDQRAGFAGGEERGLGYKNTLRLVRAGTPWRPAVPEQRRMHSTFTARIESPGGHYAHLDDEGRYRVRLDFDAGDAPESGASHPVRLLQPYGGQNWGMHFPLHAGTEVILACVGGDLDRPVILGALHNPATPSPVSSANPTQNIVRTWGGNELLMDDRQGKEKVELFTRERKNILTLDADEDGHNVRLATEEGEMEVFAAKTMLLESGDTHSVEAGNDHLITVENAQRLMTRKGEILQQAATDIRQRAAENIRMQAEQQDIELTAARDMIYDVGENCSVEVRQGDFTLITNNGQISIEAARAITLRGEGGGKIHIGQGGGAVEITPGGDFIVDAPRVVITGGSIAVKGGSIGNS